MRRSISMHGISPWFTLFRITNVSTGMIDESAFVFVSHRSTCATLCQSPASISLAREVSEIAFEFSPISRDLFLVFGDITMGGLLLSGRRASFRFTNTHAPLSFALLRSPFLSLPSLLPSPSLSPCVASQEGEKNARVTFIHPTENATT